MGFGDVLSRPSSIFIGLIIFILFFVSSVHSSRSCLPSHETTVAAANKAGSIAQDQQRIWTVKGASPSLVADESRRQLRQAPSGPVPFSHDISPNT